MGYKEVTYIQLRHIMLTLLTACALAATAATGLRFEQIDTRGHTVYCMCRDADGVVWLGTSNGLTTLAQLQSNHPFCYVRHELLKEIIQSISQDNVGRLWLTTISNRLLIYDARRNDVVTDVGKYMKSVMATDVDESLTIIGPQGILWTSDGTSIFCYDFRTKKRQKVSMPANSGKITALQSDSYGVIVATESNIYGIDVKTLKTEHVAKSPLPFSNNRIIIGRDKARTTWVAAEDKFFRLPKGESTWTDITEVHHVKGIISIESGKTYVGTTNYGLFVFDHDSAKPVNMRQAPPNTNGLPSNHIESMYFDEKRQALVIGYNKGPISIATTTGSRYTWYSLATEENQYHPEDIIAFAPSADGHSLWAGSEDGGAFLLDVNGDITLKENRYRGHTVTALFTDSRQHLWAGIYNEGLAADDGRTLFKASSPYAIEQPSPGGRLFVTLLGQGIVVIDPVTGASETVETDNPWVTELAVAEGKAYTTSNSYIYEIDGATLAVNKTPVTVFGKGNTIADGLRDMATDRRGWLWMVSRVNHSPVYAYDKRTRKGHVLKEMERYIVYAICADNDDNIWCTTDQGLVRISTDGKQFFYSKYLFNIRHDFHYNQRTLCSLANGDMVAGTSQGIIRFNPRQVVADEAREKSVMPPIITMLSINGEIQSPPSAGDRQTSLTTGDIIYTREIVLDHDEKNIVVECRPRGLSTDITHQYYYQLKGSSEEWLPLNNNTITISNLSPGKYVLLVRTAPPTDEQAEVFDMLYINIKQPFVLSPWGILLWTVLGAVLAFALYHFISNRKKYQQKIRRIEEQKQQEEKLNEMKTRFFTNISHDLRTPLTLIMAPVEELIKRFREKPAEDNTLMMLDTVKKNANQLLTLTNQIIDVHRLEGTYESLQVTPTDVNMMFSDIAATYAGLAEKQKITLTTHLPGEHHIVQIDRDKVGKITNNLLTNAFKFTPDGGSITLRCDIGQDDGKTQMVLRVEDTGGGIAPDVLPHIFERYYYSRKQHSSNESSGIGLSIVKQYTELMDGTVAVDKNSPKGTIFTVTIPVVEVLSKGHGQHRAPQGEQDGDANSAAPGTQRRATVLLVDDNTELLGYIENILNEEFNTITAINGDEALRRLRDENNDIDVVVSDIIMPGTDGYELTRQIKGDINLSHIPVILLTAKALEDDELKGLQLGANDYITKPFNTDILKLRIRAWMRRREVARDRFASMPEVEPQKLTITTLDQQMLEQAVQAVSEHMHEPDFGVDQLAAIIGVHRTGLNRKLQFITGQTPILFIRTLRLKRARQLMDADPSLPISQVAYKVGFNNPKIFSRYFAEEFGCKPSEYKIG